jgi:NTE family protein
VFLKQLGLAEGASIRAAASTQTLARRRCRMTSDLRASKSLALSGGGFRATLFHLGALWRLNELGYLSKLDYIGSVSGGSILAAYLGMKWSLLRFRDGIATNFNDEIVSPLRQFCAINIDTSTLVKALITPWRLRRPGNLLERVYRLKLYGNATLQDLPHRPTFFIYSTNLLSGKTFSFSRDEAGEFLHVKIENPLILLSQCVAASSAFPPVFSPYKLMVFKSTNRVLVYRRDDLISRGPMFAHANPQVSENSVNTFYLSDAGVISNLATDKLSGFGGEILVSDAGANLRPLKGSWLQSTWISLSVRSAMVAAGQADPIRRDNLEKRLHMEGGKGAYWAINHWIAPYAAPNKLVCAKQKITKFASLRTRLNSFNEEEQCGLINWGYAICDAHMRTHVIKERNVTDPVWPYPNHSLDT